MINLRNFIILLIFFFPFIKILSFSPDMNELNKLKEQFRIGVEKGKCEVLSQQNEEKVLKLFADFENQHKGNDNYQKFKDDFDALIKESDKILCNDCSDKVFDAIFRVGVYFFEKYGEQILKYEGMSLQGNPCIGLRKLFLEIADHYQKGSNKYLRIRFQIKSDRHLSSEEDLTNAQLTFLNKDGFEIFRHWVGNIKKSCPTTGNFEILEKDIEEIKSIRLISDQD